jgi:hypothetical protein
LIGAKSITEGDSIRVGIEPLFDEGFVVYRADRNRPWPSRAVGTNIAILWGSKVTNEFKICNFQLDDRPVAAITRLLQSQDDRLERPSKIYRDSFASKGTDFLGDGFLVSTEEAKAILRNSPEERKVLRPFLNGQDLNSTPERLSSRWIIDFAENDERFAKSFTNCWKIVLERVKPDRMEFDPVKYPKKVNLWWQHWSYSPRLREALLQIDCAIVIPAVSKLMVPARIDADILPGSALIVVPNSSASTFSVISSWLHRSWAQWWGSKMRNDFRYAISDCFDTFPFPEASKELEILGQKLDQLQRRVAIQREIGLTKLYTLVNTPSCCDGDVVELREIHEQIDRAVVKAYGFEIELGEFEIAEFKGQPQWGPPANQRIEILQLLLAENQRQQVEGVIEWPAK